MNRQDGEFGIVKAQGAKKVERKPAAKIEGVSLAEAVRATLSVNVVVVCHGLGLCYIVKLLMFRAQSGQDKSATRSSFWGEISHFRSNCELGGRRRWSTSSRCSRSATADIREAAGSWFCSVQRKAPFVNVPRRFPEPKPMRSTRVRAFEVGQSCVHETYELVSKATPGALGAEPRSAWTRFSPTQFPSFCADAIGPTVGSDNEPRQHLVSWIKIHGSLQVCAADGHCQFRAVAAAGGFRAIQPQTLRLRVGRWLLGRANQLPGTLLFFFAFLFAIS